LDELMFFFAEAFHYSRADMMAMPISTRRFVVEKKIELEKKKRRQQESANARAKSRARRR
jgi:hypothetical protein